MTKIIRSTRARVGPSLYFGVVGLLFVGLIFSNQHKPEVLVIVLIVVCIAGLLRSIRSGYIALSKNEIVVRTILRTRVFALDTVVSIEPQTFTQVTNRIIPVIKFADGSSYKLSEFFMQKRAYETNVQDNSIARLIATISESIQST